MYKRELKTLLPQLNIKHERLSKYTTMGIGGKALIVFPKTCRELVQCLDTLTERSIKFKVIGCGSNLLASSRGTDLVIVCTREMQEDITLDGDTASVACGTKINQMILWCAEHGLSGLEKLYGIPATVGGMIAMNASAFGCAIFDKLVNLTVWSDGVVKLLTPFDLEISDHKTSILNSDMVVLNAKFELESESKQQIQERIKRVIEQRISKQPKGRSAGSVFKNPDLVAAGKLIDDAGLKGLKVGKAFVSHKHANFIINEGASDKQVKKLINIVQERIKQKYNITLEREIEYLGEKDEIDG